MYVLPGMGHGSVLLCNLSQSGQGCSSKVYCHHTMHVCQACTAVVPLIMHLNLINVNIKTITVVI